MRTGLSSGAARPLFTDVAPVLHFPGLDRRCLAFSLGYPIVMAFLTFLAARFFPKLSYRGVGCLFVVPQISLTFMLVGVFSAAS